MSFIRFAADEIMFNLLAVIAVVVVVLPGSLTAEKGAHTGSIERLRKGACGIGPRRERRCRCRRTAIVIVAADES